MEYKHEHFADVKNTQGMWWRFLLLTLPVFALVTISGYFFFQSEQQTHLATARLETAHHIESQAKNIREEIMRAVLHVKFLSHHSEVIEVLAGDNEHAYAELSHDFKSFAKYMEIYDQVRLLDDKGYERVRVNFRDAHAYLVADTQLQDKSTAKYFQQAIRMSADEVFISKFDLNMEEGKIERPFKSVIRYASPVLDDTGNRLGVVVLNFLGKVLIRRYLDATDVLGENMLLSANSFFIHAVDESSTWGSVLEEREDQSMADRYPDVWNAIIDEREGQVLVDAGLFTFATISPYALLDQQEPEQSGAGDWIIVSYVPSDELFADSMHYSRFYTYGIMLLFMLWAILAWFWSRSETKRQYAYLHLQQVNHQKDLLLQRQMFVQEKERRTLARSLHDDMGQSLTSIQAYAAAIGKAISQEDCKKAEEGLLKIRDVTRDIQQSVRGHLYDLRPISLDRLGLSSALQTMLEDFARRESIVCTFACVQSLSNLSEAQNIHLFRIVQEALTNVAKHAGASHVSVRLNKLGGSLHLLISDDGCGMAEVEESGLGLLGMRERAELLQGEISIESALGKGVNVSVNIPVEEKI